MSEQASQVTPDGRVIYRWFVSVGRDSRVVTWAETKAAAREKAERRGLSVCDVTAAPPLVQP